MVNVLFIAGGGRSGSTVLHNVLGQIDGVTAVGELRYIWGRAALKNHSCGCGVPFSDCPFWQEVMACAFDGVDRTLAREMLELTESFRIRNLPLTWVPPARRRELARLALYLARLGRLYAAIHDVSRCEVIVDSSKNPSYGYLLGHVDGVDVRYLHLVRDALPVVHSWGKQKDFEPGVPMARKDAMASARQWIARNLTAELFLPRGTPRWRQLRYEDFVARPRDHVANLMRWLGEGKRQRVGGRGSRLDASTSDLPFASAHEVRIDRPAHSVFGNAARFQRGSVTLRADERWRAEMSPADRRKVTALTWPLRRRYGYTGHHSTTHDLAERLPA